MSVKTPDHWEVEAEGDGTYAIACALMALTRAIDRLGNADAATPMGAIEGLTAHLGQKMDELTLAIASLKEDDDD